MLPINKSLPFFYSEALQEGEENVTLNEETSRHIVQVLRMTNGGQLQLTNGRGNHFTAEITDNNKRKCIVRVTGSGFDPAQENKIIIGISLIKNAHRFEWFLEKAAEIGVTKIVPLICERTEKQHFRMDRMRGILISAMLQSQQPWLPLLQEPTKFIHFLKESAGANKFIAHCEEESKERLAAGVTRSPGSSVILIGPEGDFTPGEIEEARQHDFKAVALGDTRLRTETAGVVAATLLKLL